MSVKSGAVEEFCFIVGAVAFSLTLILLLLFVFRIDDKVNLNCAKFELIFATVASHTYILISSLIVRDSDEMLRTAAVSICLLLSKYIYVIEKRSYFIFVF